jgi:GNAT superfamily N-acetyltransferase
VTGVTPRLQPATHADRQAIIDLCKRSLVTTYGSFMDPERMRPWVEGGEVEAYVEKTWPRTTLAMRGDILAGLVTLEDQVIDLLWVRDELRGQGVGSLLMETAERELAGRYTEAELECFAPNVASLDFYRARGYREVRRYFEQASGLDKIVLRKPLSP